MVNMRRQQRWILGILVGLSGFFSLLEWQSHEGRGMTLAPTPHALAADILPPSPK